jgi:MFS transporter, FSR family, fosmidomycin resistance protein
VLFLFQNQVYNQLHLKEIIWNEGDECFVQAAVKTEPISRPTVYRILFAISLAHLLNDTMQAVVPATFPILEKTLNLSFTQLGWIAFALNMTSSIMQPVIGTYTDKKNSPFMLPVGMGASLIGMIGLALSGSFYFLVISVVFIGIGSAVFHPEGSRVAYMAAGVRRGLAQSIFQCGGNTGQSLAPLMTALIFVPFGQIGALGFTGIAALAILVLIYVSKWYRSRIHLFPKGQKSKGTRPEQTTDQRRNSRVVWVILVLIFVVFARSFYSAGISNFYQFYLIRHYGLSIKSAQYVIFVFLASGVLGTFLGGPLSDRFGKRNLILFSLLGATPLALLLPHVSLVWVYPIMALIGFVILSSFSVTVVYAQELVPGKIGMVSGLIVGLAFGMGALGAVVLGKMADSYGLPFVMIFCSVLPLLGIFSWLLPSDKKLKEWQEG